VENKPDVLDGLSSRITQNVEVLGRHESLTHQRNLSAIAALGNIKNYHSVARSSRGYENVSGLKWSLGNSHRVVSKRFRTGIAEEMGQPLTVRRMVV